MGKISAPVSRNTPARWCIIRTGETQLQSHVSKQVRFKFDNPLVVVGGGDVDIALLKQLAADGFVVIAADGGAAPCELAGVMPQAIIGDLDSLENRKSWEQRTEIVHISEQDSTDFEKCLYSTQAPVTLALGMTGKRLDHTLAAFDAMAHYCKNRPIILVDQEDVALCARGDFAFTVAAGDRISVYPLQAVQFVKTEGLVHALDGMVLEIGVRTGTSNAATIGAFAMTVTQDSGPYLVIVDKSYLPALMAKFTGGASALPGVCKGEEARTLGG